MPSLIFCEGESSSIAFTTPDNGNKSERRSALRYGVIAAGGLVFGIWLVVIVLFARRYVSWDPHFFFCLVFLFQVLSSFQNLLDKNNGEIYRFLW